MIKRINTTIIFILLIFTTLIISGCVEHKTVDNQTISLNNLKIGVNCNDKVICYHYPDGYAASGSCFRDEDLIYKYCINN